MRSPAVICEQWERNLSFSSADVREAGMRDAPLRMSAREARRLADEVQSGQRLTRTKSLLHQGYMFQEMYRNIEIVYLL